MTAKRTFRTQKADQRSILVQVVEGENPSPEDCTQIGRCSIRKLPKKLPERTAIDVQFHYSPDGRLRVGAAIRDTDVKIETEFARENSLPKEHLDGWRQVHQRRRPDGLRVNRPLGTGAPESLGVRRHASLHFAAIPRLLVVRADGEIEPVVEIE